MVLVLPQNTMVILLWYTMVLFEKGANSKSKGTFLCDFVLNAGFRKFRHSGRSLGAVSKSIKMDDAPAATIKILPPQVGTR